MQVKAESKVDVEYWSHLFRLMGYARGAYALGYVDDMRDPLDVLLERDRPVGLGDLAAATARARAE